MLQLRNIDKYFADRRIFAGIDWHIRPADKIGLCGENGAGKSTLLKLLGGLVDSDGGTLQVAKGTTFGYLPQDGLVHQGRSLFAEAQSALDDLLAMEAELRRMEKDLADDTGAVDLERYAELQQQFEQRGGYRMESEVGRVLSGLGFGNDDFDKPCETFSGGWQMRIALAKLLLCAGPICCCSTNRPTTSTCPRATGWKTTCWPIRMPWSWFPTTAFSWTGSSPESSRSGTGR